MLCSVRRAAALVVAPALATLALVAVPSQATAAEPSSSGSAATWLNAQLTSGIVYNDEFKFDDLGLSADVALGLNGLGGHDATVSAIAAAIEPRAHDEWYTSTYEGVTTLYAGSLAKAAVLAQAAKSDATDFGGHNLITDLAATVSATGATAGRVQDDNNDFGDTNTFGQAYAAQALDAAGNAATTPVTTFLLKQQCAPGWFRLDFAKRDAADQTCAGDATSVPDTDATAIAVVALASQADDAAVASKLALAKSWLQSAQKTDGSFGGGPTTEGPNANSTGLAGTALAALGDTAGAKKAALWVRAHQAVNAGTCGSYAAADAGSIAYDDAALTALATTPIAAGTRDKARRATAQALPVLKWAPAGTGTNVLFTAEYVRAGSTPSVGVTGAAPGDKLCATTPDGLKIAATADANGEAQFPVKLGTVTATTIVTVANAAGIAGKATIKALGAKKLRITTKAKVRKGKTVKVLVRGLAPAESVVVKIGGKKKAGQANANGRFVAKVKAKKRGKTKVVVRGQFANRTATKTVRVVR